MTKQNLEKIRQEAYERMVRKNIQKEAQKPDVEKVVQKISEIVSPLEKLLKDIK